MPESLMSKTERLPQAVGLLGGGTIGGAWAARFLLNGVDVRLYDPAPGAIEGVQAIVENARRVYRRLTKVPLPAEGSLTLAETVSDAVGGVDLVQESVPERLELKQNLLAEASRAISSGTLICSSTSSFRPSVLQEKMDRPEGLLVAHPFNPAYLMPLVELCAGERTAPDAVWRAAEIYRAVGMHPLEVRKEVDGFIANRLQEALWREALWLVHDDIATVEEVDDAVRFSFGLRRAIIGPFRIGNGEAGMRAYMNQWGPMLQWPWSKLTDVPELTDDFLAKLAAQSNVQAQEEGLTTSELIQKRDDCFVAVLQALRSQEYGAGDALARWEEGLRDRAPALADGPGPLRTLTLEMPSDWLDNNGHVTESRYLELCGYATTSLLRHIGVEGKYLANVGSYFTLETHLFHLRELRAGDRVSVDTQILAADDKRLHIFHTITREVDEEPAATGEHMLIHVAAESGRGGPVQSAVRERLFKLAEQHSKLPRPERSGARIGMR
jgi:carnitine 3-dehydrogenase